MDFALDPSNRWPGNFRDLNAMIVRMATLSDGGRITEDVVADEIVRSSQGTRLCADAALAAADDGKALADILGKGYAARFDEFDLVQLAHVVKVCRASASAADAARKLFAVSIRAKKSSNHSDRLVKYLARFGLKFKDL
jgi:transcriptional regulatory protein RtcR